MTTMTVLAFGFVLGAASMLVALLALQRPIAKFITRRAWTQVERPPISADADGAP